MNKKLITGAAIALAAGLVTFFVRKRKRKLSTAASNAYNSGDNYMDRQTQNAFS